MRGERGEVLQNKKLLQNANTRLEAVVRLSVGPLVCSGWIIITKLGGNERRGEACYLLSIRRTVRELLRAQETLEV